MTVVAIAISVLLALVFAQAGQNKFSGSELAEVCPGHLGITPGTYRLVGVLEILAAVGLIVGVIAAPALAAVASIGLALLMVGAGGAFVSVPFMAWCNVLIPNAVATSAALGFPIALSSTVGYVFSGWNEIHLPMGSLGYVWLPGAVIISACSVITAPAGARAAHRLPVKRLKQIFAVMLYMVSGFMFYRSFTH
jgi:uncharacterized membrane protein YfcA